MTFEEWRKENRMFCTPEDRLITEMAWQAAQQTERERILKIVEQVGIQGNHDVWFDCCDTIVERIKNEF